MLQSDVDFNLLLGSTDKEQERTNLKDSTGNESDALLGRLIRRLTAVIVTHLPTFWRLALSIFNGKFAKVLDLKSGSTLFDVICILLDERLCKDPLNVHNCSCQSTASQAYLIPAL